MNNPAGAPQDKPLGKAPASQTIGEFKEMYGGVYESSPWVAEGAYALRDTLHTTLELHAAMKEVVDAAPREKQLALIKAHPDLACAPADEGKLTAESRSEQKGAGLDQCTPQEFAEFQRLNAEYKEKFGFPFIVAVKGLTRADILAQFRERINHAADDEFIVALEQINKIAYFRLFAFA